jgi:hypothetical protein
LGDDFACVGYFGAWFDVTLQNYEDIDIGVWGCFVSGMGAIKYDVG